MLTLFLLMQRSCAIAQDPTQSLTKDGMVVRYQHLDHRVPPGSVLPLLHRRWHGESHPTLGTWPSDRGQERECALFWWPDGTKALVNTARARARSFA